MIYIVCRFICWLVCHIFVRIKISGKEFIPRKGGCLIASNHISFLDPPAVGSSVNRTTYFMAKSELFESKLFGNFVSKLHCFPVKREGQDHTAISTAIKILREGKALVIFPEGGRNIDGSKETLLGVGFLAHLANVPVVPTAVIGTDKALPPDAKFIRLHKIEVHFGQPIYPEQFTHSHLRRKEIYKAITQKVMESIAQLKNTYGRSYC